MRGFLFASAALALVACDSGNVPPPGQESLRAGSPAVALDRVVLRSDGLSSGTEAFYFAAGQSEVVAALSSPLLAPTSEDTNEECGAGPVDFASFGSALTVNFQGGSLVGWILSEPAEKVTVVGDVQIGTPRAEVEDITGYVAIEGSTLGEEFALGDAIGGFFEEDKVSMLYAGTQCFFR